MIDLKKNTCTGLSIYLELLMALMLSMIMVNSDNVTRKDIYESLNFLSKTL